MSNSFLYVANWERFQHYKDRRPPWIKLYLDLLSDDDWLDLSPSDRTLLMCVWMIAARDGDGSSKGRVRHDEGWLKAQAKTPKGSVKRLITAGFLTVPASTMLAIRAESAPPENREENGVGLTSEIEVSRRASLTQRSSSRARIWRVYAEYHPQAKFIADREKRLDKWLAVYDEEFLVDAVHGNHLDPHCNGQNDRGTEYHEFELIFRSAAHIERYAGVKRNGTKPTSRADRQLDRARRLMEAGQ